VKVAGTVLLLDPPPSVVSSGVVLLSFLHEEIKIAEMQRSENTFFMI